MDEVNPVEVVRLLIENCDGYVALGTILAKSPPVDLEQFKKIPFVVKAANAVGETFRYEEGDNGWPSLSLAQVAFDGMVPILMTSELSDHTRNFVVDNRVSLLIDGTFGANRMNTARVSLFGKADLVDKEQYREMYTTKHPKSKTYFDFGDFHAYAITVTRIRLNAGFGKAFWLNGTDI